MVNTYDGLDDWMITAMKASRSVSKRLAHASRGVTDLEDLVYTAFAWALENEKQVKAYVDEERIGARKARLYRIMQKSLAKDRAAHTGGKPSDSFYYTTGVVEEILSEIWDEPCIESPVLDGQPTAKGLANEGNNAAAMRVDVLRVLGRLPDDLILILRQRYQMRLTFEEIGALHDLKPDTARKRVERSVVTMLDLLGGPSPWRHSRRKRNAQAQAETSANYDGQ